jgi:hypothetical protein
LVNDLIPVGSKAQCGGGVVEGSYQLSVNVGAAPFCITSGVTSALWASFHSRMIPSLLIEPVPTATGAYLNEGITPP